jgi:large repetitive protein
MKTNHNNRPLALVLVALGLSTIQPAQAAAWTTNSSMIKARYGHTFTLLPNGKLLAAGGYSTNIIASLNYLATAELYDQASGSWTVTGTQRAPRAFHTATLLPSGKVLIVGGYGSSGGLLSSAELYDPASGTWTTTGALASAREYHTATLLPDGMVLVVGGETNNQIILGNNSLASAELYDPATGRWTATVALKYGRYQHTATLLQNGKVLVAGGTGYSPTTAAELYDPASGTWTTTGAMSTARAQHTATLLPDGRVLTAGGGSTFGLPPPGPSAELYDPVTGTWTGTGGLGTNRFAHTATLLPNGKVLAIGGYNGGALSSAELFDPATGTWTSAGALAKARQLHTATVLPNGKVLVAGGQGSLVYNDAVSKVELYDSASGTWTGAGTMATARYAHTTTLLPDGRVLVAGGYGTNSPYNLSSAELYDPVAGTWRTTSPMHNVRTTATATLLPNGCVLLAGGSGGGTSAEQYNPSSGAWTATGAMTTARTYHTATLLPNGKVLVAGGQGTVSPYLSSAELYDPATGTWTLTGALNTARGYHTATLLPNGTVLVTGGQNNTPGALASAELYDPATGTWTVTGTMLEGLAWHTATLLPNGKVLVPGSTSGEVYDPITGRWTATGVLKTALGYPTATLLPNGKVLVTGGTGGNFAGAEMYDSATGNWTTTGSLIAGRKWHRATLLPNGKVLISGGHDNNSSTLSSAEVYDVGLGFGAAFQPQIATATSPLSLGDSLALTGTGFRGVSEASGGNSQDSPSDYPLVQLRSLESGQTTFLLSTNWQTNSFTSAPVWGFPPGYALATVFVNGIPSTGSVLNIAVPVPTTPTLTGTKRLTNGACQFCFTNSVGALFGVLATTNPTLPLSNWTALGGVTEVSPGQFQFTDPQATNTARRFYRLRSL